MRTTPESLDDQSLSQKQFIERRFIELVSLAKLQILYYLDCTGVKLQPATCLQVSRLIPGGICGER